MSLRFEVLMASALVILGLVAVATVGLSSISRLVDVSRDIAKEALPDLRMGASPREHVRGLTRTEMNAGPARGER